MFNALGYEQLITALYFKGDPYLKSDAVFGVKTSLIVEPVLIKDESKSRELGFPQEGKEFWELKKDYVLLSEEEAEEMKRESLKNYYASLQK